MRNDKGLKWSLTFHSMSCLLLLVASASQSRYVRHSFSLLRAHLGAEFRVCGRKPHVMGITTDLISSRRWPLWHASEGRRLIVPALPLAVWQHRPFRQMADRMSLQDSERMSSWDRQYLWAVIPCLGSEADGSARLCSYCCRAAGIWQTPTYVTRRLLFGFRVSVGPLRPHMICLHTHTHTHTNIDTLQSCLLGRPNMIT